MGSKDALFIFANTKIEIRAKIVPAQPMIGGNDLIPRALANTLPDVRLKASVTSVRVLPDEVTVTYHQGNSHYTVSSDFVVLAFH